MINTNNKFNKYYLNESKKLSWFNFPKIALKRKNDNKYDWFPDGKINLYQNCISDHIKKNKTAIITVTENKEIIKYSYSQVDKKVNDIASFLINFLKQKKQCRVK